MTLGGAEASREHKHTITVSLSLAHRRKQRRTPTGRRSKVYTVRLLYKISVCPLHLQEVKNKDEKRRKEAKRENTLKNPSVLYMDTAEGKRTKEE